MWREKEMVVVLLAGICCLGTTFCQAEADKQPDPFENTSVLVEAFVVRVCNGALAKGDVSPIGQSPEGVSILKILWCLKDEERAEVISGAKLMARHKGEAQSKNEERFYIKMERVNALQIPQGAVQTQDVTFGEYTSDVKFVVQPRVQAENVVYLEYSYSESGVKKCEDTDSPPDQFSYDWKGYLAVQSGKPVIAGAVQKEDTTIFLILTATIQKSDSPKK